MRETVRSDGLNAAAITKAIIYNIDPIEVPFLTWEDKQYVRLSVQGYNTREDVETLICALTELLGYTG